MILDKKVDFPTEGKPTSATRASPLLLTSKPEPAPEPAPPAGSRSWALRRASFLYRRCELLFSLSLFRDGGYAVEYGQTYPFNRPK